MAVLATWGVNLQVQVAKMTPRRGEQEAGRWKERVLGELGPLGFLDVFHLVVLPVVIGLRLGDSIGLLQLADQFGASVAFFGGLLQITLVRSLDSYSHVLTMDSLCTYCLLLAMHRRCGCSPTSLSSACSARCSSPCSRWSRTRP